MKVPKARKLPSGSWFIQLRLGGESVPVTAQTEKECVRAAELIKAEYRSGKREIKEDETSTDEKTVKDYIEDYIQNRTNVRSPSTIKSYTDIKNNHFKGVIDKKLSELTEADWLKAFNEEAALCAVKTLKNSWFLLSSALKEGAKYSLPDVVFPQKPKNEKAFLEPEQIDPFIAALKEKNDPELLIASLLALCSLRRSEIFGLDWKDIDLKEECVHVRGAVVLDKDNKRVKKNTNKNETSARDVPILIPELLSALKDNRRDSGPVVSMNINVLYNKINRLCEKNELPKVGVHGLRHSFASLCYHLNVPVKITMDIGGWKDEGTVQKIYTHIAKSDMSRYKKELGGFFSKKNEETKEDEPAK